MSKTIIHHMSGPYVVAGEDEDDGLEISFRVVPKDDQAVIVVEMSQPLITVDVLPEEAEQLGETLFEMAKMGRRLGEPDEDY